MTGPGHDTEPRRDPEHGRARGARRGLAGRAALVVAGALLLVAAGFAVGLLIRGRVSVSELSNCGASPGRCGFPDAATTGVPASLTLRKVPSQVSSGPGWSFDPRGWVNVTGRGAVLSGLYIPYNVNVTASAVTIKDVKIVVGGQNAVGIALRHVANVTIENSTISGKDAGSGRMLAGVKDYYGDSTGTTILRDDISLFETGVQMNAGLVADSYIHDPGFISGDHTNGIMSNGGTKLLTITGNTILISRGQTDAIGLFQDFGGQANRAIVNNLLAGGGYVIYGGQKAGGLPTRNIDIVSNRISDIYYPSGGKYGPIAYYERGGSGNDWSGNLWDSSGQPLAGRPGTTSSRRAKG